MKNFTYGDVVIEDGIVAVAGAVCKEIDSPTAEVIFPQASEPFDCVYIKDKKGVYVMPLFMRSGRVFKKISEDIDNFQVLGEHGAFAKDSKSFLVLIICTPFPS